MALGYALLHPGRVELALNAVPSQTLFDDLTDIVMSLVGGGNPGSAASAFLDSIRTRVQSVSELVSGLGSAGGPFGAIISFLSSPPSGMPDLVGWLDRIVSFLEALAPEALRQQVTGWVDALLRALPVLDSHQMFLAVRDLLSQALAAFEKPFLDGRRDAAAHRLVRAATVAHSYLDSMLENFEDMLGGFSLRPVLEQILGHVFGALSFTGLDRVIQTAREVRDALGPILTAMSNLQLSLTVNVSVGGPSSQPLGQPSTEPTWRDDGVPTPHMPGHALWWTDLITNLVSTFNLIWELIRTAPWHRPVEVIFSGLEIAWQLVRTLIRAICPAKLNQWEPAVRWFFTDQAQFVIGLVLRWGAAFHDAFAAPNYFLGAGLRVLRYYSYALSPRLFYLWARSAWYLQSWKQDPWLLDGSGNPTTTEAPISIVRYCFAVWPVMWFTGIWFGSFLPWRDYNISEMSGLTLAMFIVGTLVGWGLSLLVVYGLGGKQPFGYPLELDWGLFALWVVASVWVALLAIASMAGVNQLAGKAPWVGLGLGVVLLVLFIGLGANWGAQSGASSSTDALVFGGILIHFTGIMAFGLISVILWWYYINESRDAEGFWNGLDATNSPYLLPYPGGRTYFCGQANHGVFSHFQSSASNRYSYDFNAAENEPIWAARDGVVVDVREVETNGSGSANWVVVQHLAWDPNHDPGAEHEHVLTYANYWHLSKDHVWVREGQRVAQGQHIADLDDTGISALHHLHFGVSSYQRRWFEHDSHLDNGDDGNVPIVFRDPSLRGFRNYPLIFSWIKGGGHTDGKPIAMSFYESSNPGHEPLPHPLAVTTQDATATGVPNHHHEIHLDPSLLASDTLPSGNTWVRTTWREGHFHVIELTRADLERIIKRRDLAGLTTSTDAGHSHTLINDPHGSTTYPAGGGSKRSRVEARIAPPPGGQVQARRPGPYDLLGDELVLRVNDRATEYYLFGASRPSLTGSLTLDRAPVGELKPRIAGVTSTLAIPARAQAVRQAARELDQAARASFRDEAFRAVPVLIIETIRRGKAASVRVGASTIATAIGLSDTDEHKGTGAMDDFDALSAATLGNLLRDGINSGWPADPLNVTATMSSGMLELHATSNVLEFTSTDSAVASSTPRIGAALKNLYGHTGPTPGTGTPVIKATGALPLTTGRLVLRRAAATWSIPVLGTPARVELDPAHAALSGAARAATPLRVRLRAGATEQKVWFRASAGDADPGDSAPEAMARRISAGIEGVRAWVNAAGKIVIETVAAGHEVHLHVDKDVAGGPLSATSTGTAPDVTATAGGAVASMGDATALAPDLLGTIIADAKWRGAQGVNADAITASVVDNRIVLAHATKTVHLTHDGTGLGFAVNGTALRSDPLTSARPRPGGWLDVHVDSGPVFRAVLDAEPARVDGVPLTRLPRSGEAIQVTVNGASTNVTFGAVKNVYDVATAIATQVSGITVRVGYRLVVETARPQGPAPHLVLEPATGAAGAGFSHDLPKTAYGWGQVPDPLAVRVTGIELGRLATRHHGPVVPAFTVAADGADKLKLTARNSQHVLAVRPLDTNPIHDPLHLTATGHELISGPIPADFALGAHCVGYRIAVDAAGAGGMNIAETIVQLSAAPATAVTTLRPQTARIPATPAGALLTIKVTPSSGPEHVTEVDLREVADLHEVAARINAAVPLVGAWVDSASGNERLHIQSRGGGTNWQLRLENHVVLAALGFDPATMTAVPGANDSTPPTYVITVSGRGNLASDAGVPRSRLIEIFQKAATHITQLDDPSHTVRRSFAVDTTATPNELVLHAAGGPVALETSPAHLRDWLKPSPDGTRIAPGSPNVRLDNGVIRVRVAGRLVAAAEVFGWSAALRARSALPTVAADVQQQLAHLHAHAIHVTVDGGTPIAVSGFPAPPSPIPSGATAFEAVVAHLAEKVPGVWFGIVDEGGAKFLAMHSRKRGRGSQLRVDLGTIPAFGLLGWSTADGALHDASGGGNVPDLDQVPLADLKTMLEDARQRGAGAQSILEARVDGNNLRLEALSPSAFLTSASAPADTPGALTLTNPVDRPKTFEALYPSARPCNPGLVTCDVIDVGGTRGVRALVWGTPARLPEMSLTASGADLNGKSLKLSVLGTEHQVTFSNIPAGNLPVAHARVAAQIEAGCRWQVRASWSDGRLRIESRREGASAGAIALLPVTNDARGSFRIEPDAPIAGAGSVPDLAAVTTAHYEAAIDSDDSAFVSEDPSNDQAACSSVDIDVSSCQPRDVAVTPGLPSFVRIASARSGCMSSVIPVVPARTLELDRTLERGPAVRASVKLDAFASPKVVPAGELVIALDGIPTAPEYAPATTVAVRFDGGLLTAQEVAARIHQELFQRGVGMAACYPDNTVVIETLVSGIAGAIEIPAAGTTPAVSEALCPGPARKARGWPGAGTGMVVDGFRSERRAPTASTIWKFRTVRDAATAAWEADFTLPSGDIHNCARALHAALGNAQQGGAGPRMRIGIAAVGPDDCLYIEAVWPFSLFLFQVNGRDREATRLLRVQEGRPEVPRPVALEMPTPTVGEGFEQPTEPGLGLRRTNQLRTVRYVRDGIGAGAIGHMKDMGWVRSPAEDRSGDSSFFPYWPAGRYLLAARAQAAKIDGYDGSGDMIISHGVDASDPSRGFVHQARYWVGMFGTREFWWNGSPNANFWGPYNTATGYAPTLIAEPLGLRCVEGGLVVEMMVWWRF